MRRLMLSTTRARSSRLVTPNHGIFGTQNLDPRLAAQYQIIHCGGQVAFSLHLRVIDGEKLLKLVMQLAKYLREKSPHVH